MTYRAKPVTQRDGSDLQNSNCLMAAAAVGLDAETQGRKTSTGSKMRSYSGDTSGGTNTDEIERAWHGGYDEDPITRDGNPFDKVLEDLEDGRAVMLQVWHATVGGPCLSGSGAYGHGITVNPEMRYDSDGSRQWLVADPWCKPPSWEWVDQSKLRAGAEKWASKIAYAVGGDLRHTPREVIAAVVKALMRQWDPEHPALADPPELEVGGDPGVLFASTHVIQDPKGDDVAINTNGSHLVSAREVDLTDDAGFYSDAGLTDKLGTLSAGRSLPLLGPAVGTNSYAVLLTTSTPYDDSQDRPTVVYVTKDKCSDPYPVDTGTGTGDDTDAVIAERDDEWRAWIDGDAHAPDRV